MLHYIGAFSERFHHPKEDAYLFERLGVRLPAAASLIDCLKQQRQSGAVKLQELLRALMRYQQAGSAAFPEFASRAAGFAAFHWDHMRLEEDELLPLARLHLTGGRLGRARCRIPRACSSPVTCQPAVSRNRGRQAVRYVRPRRRGRAWLVSHAAGPSCRWVVTGAPRTHAVLGCPSGFGRVSNDEAGPRVSPTVRFRPVPDARPRRRAGPARVPGRWLAGISRSPSVNGLRGHE